MGKDYLSINPTLLPYIGSVHNVLKSVLLSVKPDKICEFLSVDIKYQL